MLKTIANTARGLAADTVEKAASGHPGLPLGCAEIGALLFGQVMDFDPSQLEWPNRDRFVLSAGHGSALLYSFLHLSGILSLEDLKEFRQLHSRTPGHPEYGITPGVETTTGPLGQGMANGVGMALTERMLAARYNTPEHTLVDHYTYVLLGDGCMMEGVVAEAASLAGHLGLGKLISIYDDNQISIAGSTDLAFSDDTGKRFEAYGWHVVRADGHSLGELQEAIKKGKKEGDRPTLIIAKTKIAKGAPTLEGSSKTHGAPLGEKEILGLKEGMGFPPDTFYTPKEVKDFFAKRREELQKKRESWEKTFKEWGEKNPSLKEEWEKAHGLILPENLIDCAGSEVIKDNLATRESSGVVLNNLAQEIPYLIGGSADLAPSNKSYMDGYSDVQRDNFLGRNIRFGVREHAMGAICNGIALHGGLRPYCATFLVFSDYMRPAIRLAALMHQPVIFLFTHDSIFVGEDGPTHQPVEQLESLRLIPNLKVLRPADGEETREAWIEALNNKGGPTALILSRQGLPLTSKKKGREGFSAGALVVKEEEEAKVVILASGSEVSLGLEAAALLNEEGILVEVVSIPDREALYRQEDMKKRSFLQKKALRVAIEAGKGIGWRPLLRDGDLLISIEGFGMSAPYKELQSYFGLNAIEVAKKIRAAL